MRIAVAMSGGLDSTATALTLKRRGHEVLGLHMRLHSGSDRTWALAQKAAHEIRVPIQLVDLSKAFSDLVIDHFVAEYSKGRTPSPCPVCNRVIKTGLLFEQARKLGCGKLATGHYARIMETADGLGLFRGADVAKDQSYFLSMLRWDVLSRTLFPLGDTTKARVRDFLKSEGITVCNSEESQELCFIPKGDYRGFLLKRGIEAKPGFIVNLQGTVLGRHKGIIGYTVGQRRGLGICAPEPLYVIRIDPVTHTVVAGTKEETLLPVLRISRLSLLASSAPAVGDRFEVKIRSTAKAMVCTVTCVQGDGLELRFDKPQSGVATGQAAVLYVGDRVMGGGWIDTSARSDREPSAEDDMPRSAVRLCRSERRGMSSP